MSNTRRLLITVKTGKKQNAVKEDPQTCDLIVEVKGKPIKGRANKQVVEVLAKYFGVSKSAVTIVRGTRSKFKVVEIAT